MPLEVHSTSTLSRFYYYFSNEESENDQNLLAIASNIPLSTKPPADLMTSPPQIRAQTHHYTKAKSQTGGEASAHLRAHAKDSQV